MKGIVDFVVALVVLILLAPLLLIVAVAVYAYDRHSPLYGAKRVGKDGRPFVMIKFRSMVVDADKSGVTSTATDDSRITPIGQLIRRFKLDELTQFYNVLVGDMSLVGPRPNVASGTDLYTAEERHLLSMKPGVTDFASIVFADEGEILAGHADADFAYDQLIRPWKSRLGLFYIQKSSLLLDLKLVLLTAVNIVSRNVALRHISATLQGLGAPEELIRVSTRTAPLTPTEPPGASSSSKNRSSLVS